MWMELCFYYVQLKEVRELMYGENAEIKLPNQSQADQPGIQESSVMDRS
jgi:hypothetical protein